MKISRDVLRPYRNEMVAVNCHAVNCHTVHVEESDDDVEVNPLAETMRSADFS